MLVGGGQGADSLVTANKAVGTQAPWALQTKTYSCAWLMGTESWTIIQFICIPWPVGYTLLTLQCPPVGLGSTLYSGLSSKAPDQRRSVGSRLLALTSGLHCSRPCQKTSWSWPSLWWPVGPECGPHSAQGQSDPLDTALPEWSRKNIGPLAAFTGLLRSVKSKGPGEVLEGREADAN